MVPEHTHFPTHSLSIGWEPLVMWRDGRRAWPGGVWAPAEQGSINWSSCASCQNLLLLLDGYCSSQAVQVVQGGFEQLWVTLAWKGLFLVGSGG